MPRRKSKLKSDFKKQQKALQRRLIEISLEMDKYVYKNKLITVDTAKMYIQEITSYKQQCSQDIRSLQVIEKLTRQMTRIKEENEIQTYCNSNSASSGAHTSFDDKMDTTTITAIQTAPDIIETKDNETICETPPIASNNLSGGNIIVDNNNSTPVDTGINENIHENYNDAIGSNTKGNQRLIVEINPNEISEIQAIKTSIGKPATHNVNNDEDCSQSILENFQIDSTVIDLTDAAQDQEHQSDKTINIQHEKKKPHVPVFKKRGRPANSVKNNANKNKVLKEIDRNIENNSKTDDIKKPRRNPNILKKKEDKKKRINDKQKDRPKKENIEIHNTKFNNGNKINNNNTRQNNANTILGNSVNRSTENNMSWIENIKYVREITADEYDSSLNGLNESFWENLTLPDNWSDEQFAYTS